MLIKYFTILPNAVKYLPTKGLILPNSSQAVWEVSLERESSVYKQILHTIYTSLICIHVYADRATTHERERTWVGGVL